MWQIFNTYYIMRTILLSILVLCLVSCEHSHNKDCELYKAIHTNTAASIKTVIVHDTVDNTLTAQEYNAVMDIRNGKTAAHVCGATTKQGKSCKKRTKTQFCHLHTK